MEEVRAEVDRLDRMLVRLLSERQRYIERAAEIKSNRASVRDDARIKDVVAKVLREAAATGLSPTIAEPVWRELIERSIVLELEAYDARRSR
jgi:isochorismate pyruvate lyase